MPVPFSPSRPREAKLFRNNRSQAVRIPVEFELPGDRVLIRREGGKLIIEPMTRPANIIELLAEWKKDALLGSDDLFPDIEDRPAEPEDIFLSGYLLDTNIISAIIRDPNGLAARRIEQTDPREIFTSIVVAAELRYGCARKGSAKLLAKVKALLETIPVLPLDVPADADYGNIRSKLEAAGQTIGLNDLLTGAHAHALGLTLVTDNVREFNRIRG